MDEIPDRWLEADKSDQRVVMNVHPKAREELMAFLMTEPEMRGVGYSEFVFRSVQLWKGILASRARNRESQKPDDPFYPTGTNW